MIRMTPTYDTSQLEHPRVPVQFVEAGATGTVPSVLSPNADPVRDLSLWMAPCPEPSAP